MRKARNGSTLERGVEDGPPGESAFQRAASAAAEISPAGNPARSDSVLYQRPRVLIRQHA